MDTTPTYSTLLVDMDALFDTRIGTLINIDKELTERVLASGNYYKREEDRFEHITPEEFYSYYHRRNKLILASSPLTYMLQFIHEFILGTMKNAQNSPFKMIPKVVINTYPYRLTEAEDNQIIENLRYQTNDGAEIELVHLSPAELKPSYIKSNITVMVMYEYKEWLDIHAESKELEKHPCTPISLLVPGIYFNYIPDAQERKKLAKHGMSAFDALEMLSKPFINLKVLKVRIFCYKPLEVEEETTDDTSPEPSTEDSSEDMD
jgi:hypothetical protein